jgi:hypothetical protein
MVTRRIYCLRAGLATGEHAVSDVVGPICRTSSSGPAFALWAITRSAASVVRRSSRGVAPVGEHVQRSAEHMLTHPEPWRTITRRSGVAWRMYSPGLRRGGLHNLDVPVIPLDAMP